MRMLRSHLEGNGWKNHDVKEEIVQGFTCAIDAFKRAQQPEGKEEAGAELSLQEKLAGDEYEEWQNFFDPRILWRMKGFVSYIERGWRYDSSSQEQTQIIACLRERHQLLLYYLRGKSRNAHNGSVPVWNGPDALWSAQQNHEGE